MTKTTRSLSTRMLATVALPLALLSAGAARVHAETVVVPQVAGSSDGANGAGGVPPDNNGQPGDLGSRPTPTLGSLRQTPIP